MNYSLQRNDKDSHPSGWLSLSKNYKNTLVSGIIEETGVFNMEQWKKDSRSEVIMVDLEALVPKDHLLRKIEKVMDRWYIIYDQKNIKIK